MNSVNITLHNDSRKLAVIGDPVLHSLSPVIHNTMLATLGLRAVYLAQPVQAGQLADWVRCATLFGWGGFNATMPHKSALVPLMDTLSDAAALHGAVNTVVIRNGRLHGHNTDGEGFVRALKAAGITPRERKVVVLGAGGAARAVAAHLMDCGVRSLTVACRTPQDAATMIGQAQGLLHIVPLGGLTTGGPHDLGATLADCDLLVNATPLGMRRTGQDFADFDWLNALPDHAAVCDLIYNPLYTPLLKAAAGRGLTTSNGLGMLIHQAILALELFMDQSIPTERVLPAIDVVLRHSLHEAHPAPAA